MVCVKGRANRGEVLVNASPVRCLPKRVDKCVCYEPLSECKIHDRDFLYR